MKEEVLILTNDETRTCTRCGKNLNVLRFYRKGEDGFQHWCINCQRDYRKMRAAETRINQLGFSDIMLKDILKETSKLTSKQRTDLRNSLKYITSKIK